MKSKTTWMLCWLINSIIANAVTMWAQFSAYLLIGSFVNRKRQKKWWLAYFADKSPCSPISDIVPNQTWCYRGLFLFFLSSMLGKLNQSSTPSWYKMAFPVLYTWWRMADLKPQRGPSAGINSETDQTPSYTIQIYLRRPCNYGSD